MILPHLLLAQMPPGGTFTGTTGTTTSTSQSDTMPTPSVSDISGQNNPFLGSASTAKPVPGSIPITLLDAIDRGLRYNLGLYTSQIAQDTVAGARLRSLSDVLPNLSARAAESIQQINLAAFGFSVPGGPTIVGPFAVNDVRASVVSPLIDLTALNRYRSANQNVQAAQFNYKNARELVVITVGLSYLQALAAEARVGAVQA